MGGEANSIGRRAAAEIVALRETWHTKDHPFYVGFHEGTVGLAAMAKLMAQHYQHVVRALASFGLIYAKAPPDGRRFILENLAEEEGLVAGPGEDREPHDHMELIFRYCRYAGMTDEDVLATEQLPAWRARSYFYLATVRDEAFPVIVAMQSTQEGQQPAINGERTLPAFKKFHGLEMDDRWTTRRSSSSPSTTSPTPTIRAARSSSSSGWSGPRRWPRAPSRSPRSRSRRAGPA